ncbi:hypothetical protein EHI8A_001290 [Entamoeba histolytica HM-1:IMSS-B]|uniref:Protein SCAI n=6 Tax=Entamoeba histolytica TaxID=5759 RepID=C4LVP6_ENTH1|nr:hypothetical protein, conserved [Entamoeba histolytica HM-1:IMSS]EMD46770.1 Hypothetical protein EHI5A_005960 [Entamoeba histolytica KU27]EMH78075.1 hypothetical protein EHI8A_001290 [Entamoeba histolytica HM-1:IMSS-B]EMS14212.1 hypothetical protein KM1_008990 [Entamoeba histolytica HM-3:IMSS]ENY63328.1 hypothetical protein EHI7A_010350 [Entamoeba histolytica HM-1:IMSS-A]GAT92749.1 hypothetical protein conserved [Entamoeba histolytica]|eukprot:XP_656442.1 hypothetical protein, conserved [Entamoeba histolytica HM-1:IMSS]
MLPNQRPSQSPRQQDDRICDKYLKLCEKSSLLFSQLYETSFLGEGWRPLYQRTFTTFAKLWKLQQTCRSILENGKVHFKRYDVGEIAAKIAQLYYHYYLRTSETQFLNEALTYYQEIKRHNYYKEDSSIQRSFVLQRTLRFHARFLLVCLLTDKLKMGENVLSDFALTSAQLATETLIHPNLQNHQLLAEEMKYIVMNIVNFLVPTREGRVSYSALSRINPQLVFNTKPKTNNRNGLKMFSAILLDNKPNSYSFSELSISLLRMMYALEFNYQLMAPEQLNEWKNPRKHLLRNVSIPKTLNYIASTFCDMPNNTFMLLYLSSTVHDDTIQGYTSTNGLFMSSYGNQQHILHPEDLLPFLRKPILLIIDSDKQNSFIQLSQKHFDVPHLSLFGPIGAWKLNTCPLPHDSIFTKTQGKYLQVFSNKKDSIFNLFLNDSLGAFCRMTDVDQMTPDTKEECSNLLKVFYEKLSNEFFTCPKVHQTIQSFMADPFARMLILRFVFCRLVLLSLKLPGDADNFDVLLPTSNPQIPSEIYESDTCKNIVKDLANVLSNSNWFDFDE